MNTTIAQYNTSNGVRILLVQGNITEERVEAIVNAANEQLQHGGGVARAIVQKGGAVIQLESDDIGHVPTGRAAVTSAGALHCEFVIHAVGPVYGVDDDEGKLRSAVLSSFEIADELGITSISLPAISSGIFGFPKDLCAEILLNAADEYVDEHAETSLKEIRFCLLDTPTIEAFQAAWEDVFG